MIEDLKKAVIRSLEKNFKNGPITARNLAGIYEKIIINNQNMTPDQIASLINDEDMKSDMDDDSNDNEND